MFCYLLVRHEWITNSSFFCAAGSLGDLDGGEENTADNLSLSGEDGGASDPDDSAEGDSSSPPPYMPLYNEGGHVEKVDV